MGSTLTLFALNEEVAQEIRDWHGNAELPQSVDDDDADESDDSDFLRDDTVSRAHELIKDRMLLLGDGDLEQLVAALLNAMGYKAAVTPQGPDRGVDVFASPDGLGLETPRIKAEVKHRKGTRMGAQDIRSFVGGLREGDRGLYVSTGGFTKEAKYEAERATIPIKLLDLDELVSKVVAHYEEFDLDGRALIPLVRIYWPAR